ncbi:hypothetical protein [Ahniella affigens]|nr:hypothetical protein [Ahniella affigens]
MKQRVRRAFPPPQSRVAPLSALMSEADAQVDSTRKRILARMIGSDMLRRLLPGTDEAGAALTFRRPYVWLGELGHDDAMSGEALTSIGRETEAIGEWPAMLNQAERRGLPLIPPSDWIPKDPDALLLPEERGRH